MGTWLSGGDSVEEKGARAAKGVSCQEGLNAKAEAEAQRNGAQGGTAGKEEGNHIGTLDTEKVEEDCEGGGNEGALVSKERTPSAELLRSCSHDYLRKRFH